MVGDVIDARFRIDREAGVGGMGRVFEAHDMHAGRTVALKVIVRASAAAVERFERESVLLAELRHPGIVEYVAHGKLANGAPYLVMEWLAGVDLASRLGPPVDYATTMATQSAGSLNSGLPIVEVIQLARRVTATLASIHARGIIHRDIKPSNLFLPDGEIFA